MLWTVKCLAYFHYAAWLLCRDALERFISDSLAPNGEKQFLETYGNCRRALILHWIERCGGFTGPKHNRLLRQLHLLSFLCCATYELSIFGFGSFGASPNILISIHWELWSSPVLCGKFLHGANPFSYFSCVPNPWPLLLQYAHTYTQALTREEFRIPMTASKWMEFLLQ